MFALDMFTEPDQREEQKSLHENQVTLLSLFLRQVCYSLQRDQKSWLSEQSSYSQVQTQSCGYSPIPADFYDPLCVSWVT